MSTSFIKSSPKTQYATPSDIPQPSTEYPVIAGTSSPGVSGTFSRGDHVHPAETVVIGADGYGLPGECYPIVYTCNGVQYTITSNSEASFEPHQEWVVYLNDYKVPATVAIFNYDTLKLASVPSYAISNLTFGGVAPTSGVFPTLVRDKVFVRNVEVAKAADLGGYVPTDRTVNSKALSSDVTLYGSDITVTSESGADTIDTALGKKLGNTGAQTLNGTLAFSESSTESTQPYRSIAYTGHRFVFKDHLGDAIEMQPFRDGTLALLSDIYDAVQQIAPEFDATRTLQTKYKQYELVSKDGVVYQCTNADGHYGAWNASNWEAKKVSELFLPLTGGSVNGGITVIGDITATRGFNLGYGRDHSHIDEAGIDIGYERGAYAYHIRFPSASGTFALLSNLADDYDAASTYALDKLCVHSGRLYRCTTAITTAEAWTASHWTEATVQDVLAAIWTALGDIPSWAKATNKPSYTLNEVCPDSENWLGVPGTTAAGKSIKVLAKTVSGVIEGGLHITGSSNNDNNITKYRYGGVTVTRNGVATDYLFDTTSESGIVRRSELNDKAPLASPAFTGTPTAPTPTSGDNSMRVATTAFVQDEKLYKKIGNWNGATPPGGETVSYYALSSSTATLNVATAATFTDGRVLDFIVDVQNLTSSQATINFGGLGSDWYAVVNDGEDLTDMTTLAGNEIARFYFTQMAFTKNDKPVMWIAKQVVTEAQSGGGSYQIETDGTVTTEGELNTDGTFTVEGELNADGTFTVEAV